MTEEPRIDNPYWMKVQGHVARERDRFYKTRLVDGEEGWNLRRKLIPRHTWTITDPQTVKFVAGHCSSRVIDPIAGTGYWAYLLSQFGIRVSTTDSNPPAEDSNTNPWHPYVKTWVPVLRADAVDAATLSDNDTTLLLSWPPYNDPIGFKTLSAFSGNRLIYIGEGHEGACADDLFFELLDSEWTPYAMTDPVQFFGIHDYVTVYDRNQSPPSS